MRRLRISFPKLVGHGVGIDEIRGWMAPHRSWAPLPPTALEKPLFRHFLIDAGFDVSAPMTVHVVPNDLAVYLVQD